MKKGLMPILSLAVGILMLVFILMPIPASGLTIRLYFDKFQGDSLVMYYTTDENPHMGMEQIVAGTVDAGNKLAVIKLSPELADHIDRIRLDFPEIEQTLSIRNISVSSAGVIQHHYSPCDFFSETNITDVNDIPQISLIEGKKTAYIQTNESDPYILFDSGLVRDMLQYRSSYRWTRLAACILVVIGYVLYRIRPFDPGSGSKTREVPADRDGAVG